MSVTFRKEKVVVRRGSPLAEILWANLNRPVAPDEVAGSKLSALAYRLRRQLAFLGRTLAEYDVVDLAEALGIDKANISRQIADVAAELRTDAEELGYTVESLFLPRRGQEETNTAAASDFECCAD